MDVTKFLCFSGVCWTHALSFCHVLKLLNWFCLVASPVIDAVSVWILRSRFPRTFFPSFLNTSLLDVRTVGFHWTYRPLQEISSAFLFLDFASSLPWTSFFGHCLSSSILSISLALSRLATHACWTSGIGNSIMDFALK